MIKAILFDYDGVIVDSFQTIHQVYREICAELGIACPSSLEEFRVQFGYSAKELKENLGLMPHDERVDELFKQKVITKEPQLFAGIQDTIATLASDYRLILVTASLHEEARQKLEAYGLAQYFDEIVGDASTGPRRRYKKSEQIPDVLARYGWGTGEVVYVGDRNIDYDIAKEIGIPNIILCRYGWGLDEKQTPDAHIANSPAEIPGAVAMIERAG